jgi:hypothetical protein
MAAMRLMAMRRVNPPPPVAQSRLVAFGQTSSKPIFFANLLVPVTGKAQTLLTI